MGPHPRRPCSVGTYPMFGQPSLASSKTKVYLNGDSFFIPKPVFN